MPSQLIPSRFIIAQVLVATCVTAGAQQAAPPSHCHLIQSDEQYQVDKEYTFRLRLIDKPFASDEDVLAEVAEARKDMASQR